MKKLLLLVLFATCIAISCKKTSSGPKTFKITSSVDGAGTISPLGTMVVKAAVDQIYMFTAAEGNAISSITVDGAPRPIANSFTFTAVEDDHTINVSFGLVIKSVAGTNGTAFTPITTVHSGGSITTSFIPNPGFHTDSLWLDGAFIKVLAGTTYYTLTNVTATHTVRVSFSDALPQSSLDSLNTILRSKRNGTWHYASEIATFDPWPKDSENMFQTYPCTADDYFQFTSGFNYLWSINSTRCGFGWKVQDEIGTYKFLANGKGIALSHNGIIDTLVIKKLITDSLVVVSRAAYQTRTSLTYHCVPGKP